MKVCVQLTGEVAGIEVIVLLIVIVPEVPVTVCVEVLPVSSMNTKLASPVVDIKDQFPLRLLANVTKPV